ncbi:MAG: hypothetical protein AB7Q37_14080 [Pyrinomonadaceae bacterium]
MRITKRIMPQVSRALLLCAAVGTFSAANGQAPSSTPSDQTNTGEPTINSSIELGVRGLKVNGDHEKFRSDLNYRAGFRLFDSSILIEEGRNQYRAFDSALIQVSGWGSDPTGSFRMNMDRIGLYKFDSSVRRVRYFNNLKNHVPTWSQPASTGSQHQANTLHHFGDFDLTIFPERDLRFRLGYGFNDTKGPGTNTLRFRSDEYQVDSEIDTRSDDFRAGVEGKLFGFNLGVLYGHRMFKDGTQFIVSSLNPGNNPASTSSFLNTASRIYQTRGTTNFGNFFFQRTILDRFDIGGRLIYSEVNSEIGERDALTGRLSSTGNIVTQNDIVVPGLVKRPQTRADLGMTLRATSNVRISNTFTFDQFNIAGSNTFSEFAALISNNGTPQNPTRTNTSSWRQTAYKRFSDLLEADFQVSRMFGFNVGYRYTNRNVAISVRDINLISGSTTSTHDEEFDNSTHSFIAGAKIKPTSNWTIYADVERGESDNVFTRLANKDLFNFRVRSRANAGNFTFNLSAITKDNDSPGTSVPVGSGSTAIPATETIVTSKTRIFSGDIDWSPTSNFSINAGYTYTDLKSNVDVILPIGSPIFSPTRWQIGSSEFYMRDSFFFFDVSARPHKRISMFASYRFNDDRGQGDRVISQPQDIITSYPMRSHNPEIKLAFRITRNIDWNVGYQYNSYREDSFISPFATPVALFPAQNYTAHMPYTSLRIFFGPKAGDR